MDPSSILSFECRFTSFKRMMQADIVDSMTFTLIAAIHQHLHLTIQLIFFFTHFYYPRNHLLIFKHPNPTWSTAQHLSYLHPINWHLCSPLLGSETETLMTRSKTHPLSICILQDKLQIINLKATTPTKNYRSIDTFGTLCVSKKHDNNVFFSYKEF